VRRSALRYRSRVPSDRLLKLQNSVHRSVIGLTGGRVGWHVASMPALSLTTVGRHSARPRTVLLTSPLQDGDRLFVVASKGGDDRHPEWYRNLLAQPDVEVSVQGGPARRMRARVVSPDERAELWPRIIQSQPRYASYQARTTREIPVVALEDG
jgi:deazaflavin-dependent oxidoreductase (nitroreductase family)